MTRREETLAKCEIRLKITIRADSYDYDAHLYPDRTAREQINDVPAAPVRLRCRAI
jgi:hypothetical protein